MRILVIESSPHKNGLSNLLADHFIRGARVVGLEEVLAEVTFLLKQRKKWTDIGFIHFTF